MTIFDVFQSFLTFITNQDQIAKSILLVLLIMYSLFALVLARQIFILTTIIDQISFSPIFKIFALLHVGIAVALILITVLSFR